MLYSSFRRLEGNAQSNADETLNDVLSPSKFNVPMKTNFTRDLAWKKSVLFILFAILFLLSLSKVAFT